MSDPTIDKATDGDDDKNQKKTPDEDENDSDVEMDGMDLEGDEDGGDEDMEESEKASNADEPAPGAVEDDDAEQVDKLEHEDHDEIEAARKERLELMAAESSKTKAVQQQEQGHVGKASVEEQLQYLLEQSEVFAHFLAGRLTLCPESSLFYYHALKAPCLFTHFPLACLLSSFLSSPSIWQI